MADTGENREIKQRVNARQAELVRESAQLEQRTQTKARSLGIHRGTKAPMSRKQGSIDTEPMRDAVRPHQPGQDIFKAVLPEEMDWKPFASFPPSVRLALVVGQPSEKGPYTIRVKVPHGVKLMPHKHPEDRVYTVISGVFYIGRGDQFDADKLEAYAPGSVIILPGNTSHFHWAKSGEYVTQVTAIGPLGLNYVNPKDDPRNGRA